MKREFFGKAAVLLAAVAILAAPEARASLIFDLGVGNSDISGHTGPYAQVDVSLTSSTEATITFTSLTAGGNIYLLGDSGVVGVNVNGTYTLGPVSESNAGTGYTPSYKENAPGSEDGFGSFNLSLNNNDGNGDAADTISFTITDTSGTWASASDVLAANGSGYEAAAHIFVTASPADASAGALVTGYAGGNGVVVVPEPTTMIAGALLLLPFGASTLRMFRKNRVA